VTVGALLVASAITAIRFVTSAFISAEAGAAVVFPIAVGLLATATVLLTAWLVRLGHPITPVMVTFVALWNASEIWSWGDWLAWISVGVAVVTMMANFWPTSQSFRKQMKAQRSPRENR
jgi:hypothetical protein